MTSILDRSFEHYSSLDTDVRRTFRLVRDQLVERAACAAVAAGAAQAAGALCRRAHRASQPVFPHYE